MEKRDLVERAKLYLEMFCNGVHPVTGDVLSEDSAFMDEKVKKCFSFISEILDEYLELSERVEELENNTEITSVILTEKQEFAITSEQCENIKLSLKPVTVLSFMRNINSVIDPNLMEKLTASRVNKWLTARGFVTAEKVQSVINRTVYKPSETATKIGIVEEEIVDRKSGEIKQQLKLDKSAQLFIVENLSEIVKTTKR